MTLCHAIPLEAEEEATKTKLSVPTARSNQSVPSEVKRSPLVGVVLARSLNSSSYACTSVPMVRPKLPMAVEVAPRSVRLLEATNKATERSVDVPLKNLMESPPSRKRETSERAA